mmetsp:Transcript_102657/g.185201  ORF Transcript_102657/g.185201 Transcript_102657/m.185201 type:complete len:306 (-) Transcript_102657:185-1102(-)
MAKTAAVLGVCMGLGLAGTSAFVAPGAQGAQGRLRASGMRSAQISQPTFGATSPAGSSSSYSLLSACSAGTLLVAAAAAVTRRAGAGKALENPVDLAIPRPEDLLESPKFPKFFGGTNGYMSRATRERHAITWTSPSEMQFEMPIGGTAVMNKGENLCYFRKKEQCIALGKQLRKMKIDNYKVYRLQKDGTVIFMHPADGVFPEKVNKGRIQVNGRPFTVLQNPQQASLKWTKYHFRPYEADPLTTLFVRARLQAYNDIDNIFVLPQPDLEEFVPVEEAPEYTKQEYTTKLMEALKKIQEDRKSL